MRSWVEVPCRIESAKLEVHEDSDGDSSKCLATYRYRFAGRTWKGDRVSLYTSADNIGDFQQRTYHELSQYAESLGAVTPESSPNDSSRMFRCYVNPDSPSEAVLYRTIRWQLQAFMAIFALTFPAVGAGLFFGGLISVWKTYQNRKKPATFLEGWPFSEQSPVIAESGTMMKTGLGLYTVWSALVIAPLLVCVIACGALHETPTAALLIIYPLLWSIPAWFSLRHLRQHLLIGRARFLPANTPTTCGGHLEGYVLLEKSPPMHATVEISVDCFRRVTRKSSDGDSTSSEIIWSGREEITSDAFSRELTTTRIPVRIPLPATAPTSGPSGLENTDHAWNLRLRVPGTPVNADFDITVVSGDHSAKVARAATNINPAIPNTCFRKEPNPGIQPRHQHEL